MARKRAPLKRSSDNEASPQPRSSRGRRVVPKEKVTEPAASPVAAARAAAPPSDAYTRKLQSVQERGRRISTFGRDIGSIPDVANPKRREKCRRDFRRFCETYLAATFSLEWSADHRKAISHIEEAVLRGGLFAWAMPRGTGKSSLIEGAAVWAMIYGHREFVALIGPSETHAEEMLGNIQIELQTNELLGEDFPEVCYPIERLEGIAQRANGQLCRGERTYIEWGRKTLVLPTIARSPASGALVKVAGITGQIRGMSHKRPDGRKVRPDFVVIDDPQTDESARSPAQCRERERILSGAILGLAGPGKKISGFMPCTVIRHGDMADSILDRTKHPEWQGERFKAVYEWPTRQDLWDEYARIRRESLLNGGRGEAATTFYRKHRKAMDEGSVVAWPRRFNDDELSAIQHAWNLRIADEAAFFAEHQNEPLPEEEERPDALKPEDIIKRVNGRPRGVVPDAASHLTMMIDVQGSLLYWLIAAWQDDFTGVVVDYGTWPKQPDAYFTLRTARRKLRDELPRADVAGRISHGLRELCQAQLERQFTLEGGGVVRVARCLVDAGWGETSDTVYEFCRHSQWAAVLMPSLGRYIGAKGTPFSEYKTRRGERVGFRWRIPPPEPGRPRRVLIDVNFWKTFVHGRLSIAPGDRGALTFFGDRPIDHQMLAEHITAEKSTPVEANGRTVDEWTLRRPGLDNHLFDCLVGAAVAGSMQGASLDAPGGKPQRTRLRLSELQRRKRR